MDPRYVALVEWILHDYDVCMRIAGKPYATERARGQAEALTELLVWLQGYEHTDLDGLRKMVAEHS